MRFPHLVEPNLVVDCPLSAYRSSSTKISTTSKTKQNFFLERQGRGCIYLVQVLFKVNDKSKALGVNRMTYDHGLPVVVLESVEVAHTDLTEVTGVVLVHVGTVCTIYDQPLWSQPSPVPVLCINQDRSDSLKA